MAPVKVLGDQPELQQHLRENRDLISPFIEEALRFESPTKVDFRLCRKSTTLGGTVAQAWMSEKSLAAFPEFTPVFKQLSLMRDPATRARAQALEIGRRDEDVHAGQPKGLELGPALHVDLEDHVGARSVEDSDHIARRARESAEVAARPSISAPDTAVTWIGVFAAASGRRVAVTTRSSMTSAGREISSSPDAGTGTRRTP